MAHAKNTTDRTSSKDEIAELFDVTPKTVTRWASMGCPHDGGGRSRAKLAFDSTEVASWIKDRGLTTEPGSQTTNSAEERTAKHRKEMALAETYELRLAKERGQVIDASEERERDLDKVAAVRSALLSLGPSIAAKLVGKTAAQIEKVIDDRAREICESFAKGYGDKKGAAA